MCFNRISALLIGVGAWAVVKATGTAAMEINMPTRQNNVKEAGSDTVTINCPPVTTVNVMMV